MNRWPRCILANDKLLTLKIRPNEFAPCRKIVISGQNGVDPFKPQCSGFAIRPIPCSGDEGRIEPELPDSRNMLLGVTVDQIHSNARVVATIGSQQLSEKA